LADVQINKKILDMGAGWGLSSEFFASLGLKVTALDINKQFIRLIKERSHNRNTNNITKFINSSFMNFNSNSVFDYIFFYECFHHEPQPWKLIKNLRTKISHGGKIILAGEPIQNNWKHWGLRLDPLSIYCIKKFGWFESGWSKEFLIKIFNKNNFDVKIWDDSSIVGPILVAEKKINTTKNNLAKINHHNFYSNCESSGLAADGLFMIGGWRSYIKFSSYFNFKYVILTIFNFSSKNKLLVISPLKIKILIPGENKIRIYLKNKKRIDLFCNTYVPSKLIAGSKDSRKIGYHLKEITFE
jgi:SAM-dependent methyltransferase